MRCAIWVTPARCLLAAGPAQEKEALADRREFLRFAATGCERFELNRSAWALDSEPAQVGGLIYW
jgi:hypothetical protein